jgi:hypothetical protein
LVNELKIKQEVIAVYERYLDAFKKSDQEGINECLSVPFYRFENGEIRSFDGFYTNVSDLKKKGYRTTIAMDYSVASVDETKAHIVLKEGLRVDENDEPFQIISRVCVFVKKDNK